MKVLGITGGIGSGKSVVCQLFLTLGIPVFDSDREAKARYGDVRIQELVSNSMGENLFPDGKLDREKLAAIVFSDKQKLEALNGIIHPEVALKFDTWAAEQDAPFVIKEAAILFETGGQQRCSKAALVTSPQHLRLSRIMKRDGVTEEQVRARMKNQWSDEQKRKLADFEITNNEELPLIPQVKAIYDEMLLLERD